MSILQFQKDNLAVEVFETRAEMGQAAADDIAVVLKKLLAEKDVVRIVFAAAPSQNEVLAGVCARTDLDWSRVDAFHMDEYEGLDKTHPQSFGTFLREHVFDHLPLRNVYYISDYGEKYEELLEKNPIDIVILGIGENGHIAFNDPGVADFNDPKRIKRAKLDDVCRQQQVNDGCFDRIEDVPTHAMTLTIPALVKAPCLFCIVPAASKAKAVKQTLYGPISESCPASILRQCEGAKLYLDADSGELL